MRGKATEADGLMATTSLVYCYGRLHSLPQDHEISKSEKTSNIREEIEQIERNKKLLR